jgi:hypothetical protein
LAWRHLADRVEVERTVIRKLFDDKELFTELMHLYAVIYKEMVKSLQTDHRDESDAQEDFKEQRWRRRKRSSSGDQAKHTKKTAKHTTGARGMQILSQLELPTCNFFSPIRTAGTEINPTEGTNNQTDGKQQQQSPNSQRGRPPPIILTSAINLIQLLKQLKGLVKGSFEIRNTRNGTRIVINEMADYSAIKEYINFQKSNYFTFYSKSLKPIKGVI